MDYFLVEISHEFNDEKPFDYFDSPVLFLKYRIIFKIVITLNHYYLPIFKTSFEATFRDYDLDNEERFVSSLIYQFKQNKSTQISTRFKRPEIDDVIDIHIDESTKEIFIFLQKHIQKLLPLWDVQKI